MDSRFAQKVAVIYQDGGGSSEAGTPDACSTNNGGEPSDLYAELNRDED